jgi:thioredoxin reductase
MAGIDSEQRLNGFGVSAVQCATDFFRGKAAIVGAGDTACEEAFIFQTLLNCSHARKKR